MATQRQCKIQVRVSCENQQKVNLRTLPMQPKTLLEVLGPLQGAAGAGLNDAHHAEATEECHQFGAMTANNMSKQSLKQSAGERNEDMCVLKTDLCPNAPTTQARKRAAFLKEHLGRDLQLDEYEQLLAAQVINPRKIEVELGHVSGLDDLIQELEAKVVVPMLRPELRAFLALAGEDYLYLVLLIGSRRIYVRGNPLWPAGQVRLSGGPCLAQQEHRQTMHFSDTLFPIPYYTLETCTWCAVVWSTRDRKDDACKGEYCEGKEQMVVGFPGFLITDALQVSRN
eukprot:scaffold221370_cov21-Tisochrysis_lutea.AAC.1